MLRQHLRNNLVRIGGRWHVQSRGIPQASPAHMHQLNLGTRLMQRQPSLREHVATQTLHANVQQYSLYRACSVARLTPLRSVARSIPLRGSDTCSSYFLATYCRLQCTAAHQKRPLSPSLHAGG